MKQMDEERVARADAKAEKARTKALRPWYKKKRFIVPMSLVGLMILAMAVVGGDSNTSRSDNGRVSGKESVTEKAIGLNQAARDGKFEFVVKGIQCGKEQVGTVTLGERAQGQFCFLSIKVTNISDEPQMMFAGNQYLLDSQNRRFSADASAQIYANEARTIFEEINPGNTLEGIIIFDVPKDVKPMKAELHDSAFSGGVHVQLP